MTLAEMIKDAREKRGLTRAELAKLTDLSRVSIWGYEQGKTTPSLAIGVRIFRILNIKEKIWNL